MAQEAFCPEHGPYDASLGACPYPHAGAAPRPGAPLPLDDDLPTDLSVGRTVPTVPGRRRTEDEDEAELPAGYGARHGVMDISDEEETQIPRSLRDEDVTELEAPVAPVLGLLWVTEGPRRGKYYPIKHGTIIGRKEGSLILDDPKVSSRHAKFMVENDDFVLWDLGSANGTMVNGRKIRKATRLVENDLIKIGESVFVVKLLETKPKRRASRKDSTPTEAEAKRTRKAAG